MTQRKYFNANVPYDETVTGIWTELITEYLDAFIEFLNKKSKRHAVNETRLILLRTFSAILTQPQRFEDMMNIQCVVFPRNARIDIRFHQPTPGILDTQTVETERGYQIEGLTLESKTVSYSFVYRLEIKEYRPPPHPTKRLKSESSHRTGGGPPLAPSRTAGGKT